MVVDLGPHMKEPVKILEEKNSLGSPIWLEKILKVELVSYGCRENSFLWYSFNGSHMNKS